LLEPVNLAHLRDSHCAPAFIDQFVGFHTALLRDAIELPEPGFEDTGHTAAATFLPAGRAIQRIQVAAGPEARLKIV
jgi:hypothetical protein